MPPASAEQEAMIIMRLFGRKERGRHVNRDKS